MSPGLYLLYQEHAHTLSSLAMYQATVNNVVGEDGEAERVDGQQVTTSLFDVLRVPPVLGRPLLPADAERGGGAGGCAERRSVVEPVWP